MGSEFKNVVDALNDVFEVTIVKGFALPLMFFGLAFPEITGEFCSTIFPTATDSHALVQLDAHVRKTCLPNVMNFEFPFDSGAQKLRSDSKHVLHTRLWIDGEDVFVAPDLVKRILDCVNKSGNLSKLKGVNL